MRRRVLAALVATLALAACGGDDEGPATTTTTTTAAAEPLVAAFSYEVDQEVTGPTSCPARAVLLTDESTGDPESWEWELPDGTTSTEQHPRAAPEMGEVTLTVRRGDESDSTTELVTWSLC